MTRRLVFRRLAIAAFAGALGSACINAFLDAANIAGRAGASTADQRPLWLHTYSMAVVTVLVVALALLGTPAVYSNLARFGYLLTAALNLSVIVVGMGHDGIRIFIPVVHLVLAGLLIAMFVVARDISKSADTLADLEMSGRDETVEDTP